MKRNGYPPPQRIAFLLLAALFLFMGNLTFVPTQANAEAREPYSSEYTVETEDGSILIWKKDSSTSAVITGYVSLTPNLIVPSEIEGRKVLALGSTIVLNQIILSCQ